MATNYNDPLTKGDVAAALLASTVIPDDLVSTILKSLGRGRVDVNEIDSSPTRADLKGGVDLLLVNLPTPVGGTGEINLSKLNLKNLDTIISTSNEDTNVTVAGKNGKDFDGVIVTGGGDDNIRSNSEEGVGVSSDGGNDTVTTGKGNDTVYTGSGNDSVTTGDGNDKVYVGSGNDTVSTGKGNDLVKLDSGFIGNATFDAGSGGNDKLDLSGADIKTVVNNGGVVTITLADNSVITASNFEKFIYDDGGAVPVQVVGVNPFDAAF